MARALSPDLASSNSTVTWVSYPYSCWQTSKGARWLQNPFELQINKLPVPAWLLITIGFTLLQPLHSHFDSKTNGNPINPRITCSSCDTKKNWPLQQGLAHVFLISPLTFQVQLPKSVALRWCDFLPPLPPLASPRETRSLRVSCDSWNSHWQQLMTCESISYDLPIWWFGVFVLRINSCAFGGLSVYVEFSWER